MTLELVRARIERLSARLKSRKPKRTRRPRGYTIHIAKAAYLRQRRDLLEANRSDWADLIVAHHGNVAVISRIMGVCRETADRAIWDLGLWPALIEARRQR